MSNYMKDAELNKQKQKKQSKDYLKEKKVMVIGHYIWEFG